MINDAEKIFKNVLTGHLYVFLKAPVYVFCPLEGSESCGSFY